MSNDKKPSDVPEMKDTVYKGAKPRLMSELKGFEKEKWLNIETNNDSLFKWNVGLMITRL